MDALNNNIDRDTVELLMEHIYFTDICGKGFQHDESLWPGSRKNEYLPVDYARDVAQF